TDAREHRYLNAVRITDQVLIFSRMWCHDCRAVVESCLQMPPFPPSQGLWGGAQLAASIVDVMARECRDRSRNARTIALISRGTLSFVRLVGVLLRHAGVVVSSQCKKD